MPDNRKWPPDASKVGEEFKIAHDGTKTEESVPEQEKQNDDKPKPELKPKMPGMAPNSSGASIPHQPIQNAESQQSAPEQRRASDWRDDDPHMPTPLHRYETGGHATEGETEDPASKAIRQAQERAEARKDSLKSKDRDSERES